jgi:Glycoside hydrolase family 44
MRVPLWMVLVALWTLSGCPTEPDDDTSDDDTSDDDTSDDDVGDDDVGDDDVGDDDVGDDDVGDDDVGDDDVGDDDVGDDDVGDDDVGDDDVGDDDTGDDDVGDDDVGDDDTGDDDTGDDDTLSADVEFAIDSAVAVHPISPYIYGTNSDSWTGQAAHLTLGRAGGNRWTAYNWETNASNAGSDWYFHNDGYLGGGNTVGEAVRSRVQAAHDADASMIVTVPIAGHVAADKDGTNVFDTPNHLDVRFHQSPAFKGSALSLTPDTGDDHVYQDEFVNWLTDQFPNAPTDPQHTIFYCLDNEPDLWADTHEEIHPAPVTYVELGGKNIEYADAIKSVLPSAVVFGFVSYGWYGFTALQGAPDAATYGDFTDYYLDTLAAAESAYGYRLVDVLDLHWYPEAQGNGIRITNNDNSPAVVEARIQAPRSLWDPTYVETSWITQSLGNAPIELLPLMYGKIAAHYPGTDLAITEYNYGGYGHISGGIAQADVLGIYGREEVFAATLWELGGDHSFHYGAFALYRNYDGNGAAFGDTSISATTDDIASTSIHASVDAGNPDRMVLVVINKADTPQWAHITVQHGTNFGHAEVYQLTSASSAPVAQANVALAGNELWVQMPEMSATTLALEP